MKKSDFPAVRLVRGGSTEPVEDAAFDADALEAAMEFDPDELREFLAADLTDVAIDPAFKHRLRSRLWNIVRFRYARSARSS